jgi:hypothetical protein
MIYELIFLTLLLVDHHLFSIDPKQPLHHKHSKDQHYYYYYFFL